MQKTKGKKRKKKTRNCPEVQGSFDYLNKEREKILYCVLYKLYPSNNDIKL